MFIAMISSIKSTEQVRPEGCLLVDSEDFKVCYIFWSDCIIWNSCTNSIKIIYHVYLTLKILRGQIDPSPSIFLALNLCCSIDYQKLWYNCSLFVNTSFDTN